MVNVIECILVLDFKVDSSSDVFFKYPVFDFNPKILISFLPKFDPAPKIVRFPEISKKRYF